MDFNPFSFIIFYPLLFLLYYFIPAKLHVVRNVFLLGVSYLLYASLVPVYSIVLIGVTATSYFIARLLENNSKDQKIILSLGCIITLLPLFFFKYSGFLNKTISGLLVSVGFELSIPGLNWAIPIGLSFFTLQAIGYVIDVYHNRISAEKNFLDYALFIAFFPSIVSGPINKASLMLPQIKSRRPYFNYAKAVDGLKLVLWGVFMKVVVADRAGLYVDTIYYNYGFYSGFTCFVASIMYSVQIYCDFAGYSLLALGVGKTLGFDLTENFKRPYFSASVREFWKRWHISLSVWLRDYIYIPLGGNQKGEFRTYRNLIITFIISGLWHGANWTFIIWGITHAIWIIIERILDASSQRKDSPIKIVKILITFFFINFAWILFRMPNLADVNGFISRFFTQGGIADFSGPPFVLVISVLVVLVKDIFDEFFPNRLLLLNNPRPIIRWTFYVLLLVFIITQGVLDTGQFIYAYF